MPFGASKLGHLPDAGLVGPDAAADGQRRGVDPDAVAAFDRTGSLDAAEDGHAHAAIGSLVQAGLGTPQRLAHGEDDGAVVGHQRRIMREDGIGEPVIRRRSAIRSRRPKPRRGRRRPRAGGAREPGRIPARSATRRIRRGAWRLSPSASARVATGAAMDCAPYCRCRLDVHRRFLRTVRNSQ